MSPDECLKILQRIRFSPRAGRPVSLSWIARQANYQPHSLMHAIARGHINHLMARRLAPVLARLMLEQAGHNSPTLGRLGGDDAAGQGHRGDWRPKARKASR